MTSHRWLAGMAIGLLFSVSAFAGESDTDTVKTIALYTSFA